MDDFAQFSEFFPNPEKSSVYLTPSSQQDTSLQGILIYPIKWLPINYLGLPLDGRELRSAECAIPFDQLNNYLLNWKNKTLSYGGRLQLAKWVLYGKLGYWFQGKLLPKSILDKVKSVVYKFMRDGGRGVSWWQMAKD